MPRLTILYLGVCMVATPVFADDVSRLTQESRATVKIFAGKLKGELQAAMKKGGPVSAIQVCNSVAPAIAKDLSKEYRGKVARVSLKTRNSANKPDAWETKALQEFERRKASGTPVKQLEVSDIVEVDGIKQFRYMKAIPTGDVCLMCHGKKINPEVEAKLAVLYPEDQARGYSKGDVRGAFTLMKKID